MTMTRCRHFNGYKPCGLSDDCSSKCKHFTESKLSILIVHLGALGAVVRSTALLKPIKRKYSSSRITWVTDAPAHQLLNNHQMIDRVVTTSEKDLLALRSIDFDIAFIIDKSLKASGVMSLTQADMTYGFTVDSRTGAVLPATWHAQELWELGISNHKKFFVNKKPETQLIAEALDLPYERDPYNLQLTFAEKKESDLRKSKWKQGDSPLIGLNTGCSDVIAYKKWTVEYHRQVIQQLKVSGYSNIVLLGGPEDTERNKQIAQGLDVISSPTENGLRDGLISTESCDLVITGDSLGMHMAIALEKFVIAWFGPTCAHEIDLYDKGIALQAKVNCSPCWKRSCQKEIMCYDRVEIAEVLMAVAQGASWLKSKEYSSYKRPSLEI